MFIACTLMAGGRFLKVLAGFFFFYAGSVGIFLARAHLPAEFEEVTRLSGVTVQAAALLLVAWMCFKKDFD